MIHAIEKVKSTGNDKIWITERGSSFGYSNLVVDFTGFPVMRSFGCPLVLDCTHSLQLPNQSSGITGGKPEFIETLAKAGIATGADAIFMETHPNPSISKSDGANMIPLSQVERLLEKLVNIKKAL
jgi:2-dehydro-3-deoxyphosphooctonate aldolase (KDO 8-P synthase)